MGVYEVVLVSIGAQTFRGFMLGIGLEDWE